MKKPKHVHGYVDRHGKARFYFRRKGCPQISLPGLPWSPEFMAAYHEAMSSDAPRTVIVANRIKAGTIDALVHTYLHSVAFSELATETQRTRRNILKNFAKEHGDKRVAKLKREHAVAMFTKKKDKRFAARNWLKTVRALMQFGISNGALKDDPTFGIKNMSGKTDGFRTWDEDDIAAFEERWPIGTRERLALALLLYTGQRRGDVVRMGRQHVRNEAGRGSAGRQDKACNTRFVSIDVRQQKTGTKLTIPVHPHLKVILDDTPSKHLTFLTTSFGKPFVAAGFTNWFREACNAAALPKGTSAHGLRKAAARRLAEAGCSANVIASITGHKSLSEIERYTKAADQARMARDGMAILVEQGRQAKQSGTK